MVGSHHLHREFGALGYAATHVPVPLGAEDVFTADHLNFKRIRAASWRRTMTRRRDAQSDRSVVSLVPWAAVRRFGMAMGYRLGYGRMLLPGFKEADRSPELLIVDHPRQFWLVRQLKPKTLLYRPTDAYSYAGHKDHRVTLEIEGWLLERADGLVLTARQIEGRMQQIGGGSLSLPMIVEENGVDLSIFRSNRTVAPRLSPRKGGIRLFYVGSLDARFDHAFVAEAARRNPACTFTIAGPPHAEHGTVYDGIPNVHLLGPVRHQDLPDLMSRADVGLLPLSDHPFNATRSPMKLYEYAAAGLPVVYRASPELCGRGLPFAFPYQGPDDFVAAVGAAALYRQTGTAEMRAFAEAKSWRGIAERILDFARHVGARV